MSGKRGRRKSSLKGIEARAATTRLERDVNLGGFGLGRMDTVLCYGEASVRHID